MNHLVIERWSRGSSTLHARDARAKIVLLLAFLAALATTPRMTAPAIIAYAAAAMAGILLARLPVGPVLLRAAVVLPFSGSFALISILAGDAGRAVNLLAKSYLSAIAVLLVAGSTPLPSLLRALESLGAPRFLALVVQFLYRYLFVISEQAQHMRLAALSRGGGRARLDWHHAAGAVSVLFARSYARAAGIHRAMLARGFAGTIELLASRRFQLADAAFLAAGLAAILGLRLAVGVMR